MAILRRAKHLWRSWLAPVFPLGRLGPALRGYRRYLGDWRAYRRLPGAEAPAFLDSYPCLDDAVTDVAFDAHYVYQALWAAALIANRRPRLHVDIASDLRFVTQLAAALGEETCVAGMDLRLTRVEWPRLAWLRGDLLRLPFAGGALRSLSCLHVIEHIGLGRYGDRLDPDGSRAACAGLARLLAPGGELYLSAPVGRPRLQFNAQRIFAPGQIPAWLPGLRLVNFSAAGDDGRFYPDADPARFAAAGYACGMYHFQRDG